MRFEKYDISTRRVNEDDIELIRQWRNAPSIRNVLKTKSEISRTMQRKWFEKVAQNSSEWYFLSSHEGVPFCVNSIHEYDHLSATAKTGIFVGNRDFINSHFVVHSILCMIEIGFYLFGITCASTYIKSSNLSAIKLNLALGYKEAEQQMDKEFIKYDFTRKGFESKGIKLQRAALAMSELKANSPMDIILEDGDAASPVVKFVLDKYKNLNPIDQKRFRII